MNKQSFLEKLAFELKGIPWQEIQKQKAYYEEMLDDMLEDGMTEEQAVEKLGDPVTIAREILQEPGVKRVVLDPSQKRVMPGPAPAGNRQQSGQEPRQAQPAAPQDNKKTMKIVTIVLLILGAPIWISLLAVVLSLYLSLWAVALSFDGATLALGLGGLAMLVIAGLNITTSPAGALAALGIGLLLLALALLGVLLGDVLAVGLVKGTRWAYRKCKTWIRSVWGN